MAARNLFFATEAEARTHIVTLDAANKRDGIPLPRCDSYKWGDPDVKRGRNVRAKCPCLTRDAPDPGCPYVTWTTVDVMQVDRDTFVVEVTEVDARAKIDTSAAREMTEDEIGKAVRKERTR